jgi:hypothetical protein
MIIGFGTFVHSYRRGVFEHVAFAFRGWLAVRTIRAGAVPYAMGVGVGGGQEIALRIGEWKWP